MRPIPQRRRPRDDPTRPLPARLWSTRPDCPTLLLPAQLCTDDPTPPWFRPALFYPTFHPSPTHPRPFPDYPSHPAPGLLIPAPPDCPHLPGHDSDRLPVPRHPAFRPDLTRLPIPPLAVSTLVYRAPTTLSCPLQLGLPPARSHPDNPERNEPMTSVFADLKQSVYPHRWKGTLLVHEIHGGTPSDPNKAEGWIKSKMELKDDTIRSLVIDTMAERGITAEEAVKEAASLKHLNGFKRDSEGLYIEGRQLKAAIKEAANIRWPKERWGVSRKGTRSFFAEHVFVEEERLHLGVAEPSGIHQRFVHTWKGAGIQYEEYVTEAKVSFHVLTDNKFTKEQWAQLWLTGEQQGVGASRSLGFGTYEVIEWSKA